MTRVGKNYETSSEFVARGFPARRPWFPVAGHYNFQEIIPSIEDGYPYPIKALTLYWNGIPYSTPGARAVWERVVSNPAKIPLLVVIDIAMSDAAIWADYVLPDTTYFERWTAVSVAPTIVTNLATDAGGPADPNYLLARGGRFENADQAYDGAKLRNRFSGRLYFFNELLGKTKDSMTGQYFDGTGKYEPIADVSGAPVSDAGFPLQLITYKKGWHTQMHTIRYPWLVSVQPENFVELNSSDGAARGGPS